MGLNYRNSVADSELAAVVQYTLLLKRFNTSKLVSELVYYNYCCYYWVLAVQLWQWLLLLLILPLWLLMLLLMKTWLQVLIHRTYAFLPSSTGLHGWG